MRTETPFEQASQPVISGEPKSNKPLGSHASDAEFSNAMKVVFETSDSVAVRRLKRKLIPPASRHDEPLTGSQRLP